LIPSGIQTNNLRNDCQPGQRPEDRGCKSLLPRRIFMGFGDLIGQALHGFGEAAMIQQWFDVAEHGSEFMLGSAMRRDLQSKSAKELDGISDMLEWHVKKARQEDDAGKYRHALLIQSTFFSISQSL
jgi:hypothetical protein